MPTFEIVFYEDAVSYMMATDEYMFNAFLDPKTGTTHCILGIAGPTKLMISDESKKHIIFGQQYFTYNPLLVIVDRSTNSYSISIGNAIKTEFETTLIWTIVIVTFVLLIVLIYFVVRLVE